MKSLMSATVGMREWERKSMKPYNTKTEKNTRQSPANRGRTIVEIFVGAE
jgi:hypothetical protein